MTHPIEVTLTGIGSVDPGTGPGESGDPSPSPVPLPAALPLFSGALALLGFVGVRRRKT